MSIALLILLAAIVGGTAMMGLIGGYLYYRIRRIEARTLGETGPHQLLDQVSEMREDLFTVQERMSTLTERLDFTEKLLMSADDAPESDGSE